MFVHGLAAASARSPPPLDSRAFSAQPALHVLDLGDRKDAEWRKRQVYFNMAK